MKVRSIPASDIRVLWAAEVSKKINIEDKQRKIAKAQVRGTETSQCIDSVEHYEEWDGRRKYNWLFD